MSTPMCSYCGAPCTPQQADESAFAKAVIEVARTLAKKDTVINWRLLRDAVKALEAAEKGE